MVLVLVIGENGDPIFLSFMQIQMGDPRGGSDQRFIVPFRLKMSLFAIIVSLLRLNAASPGLEGNIGFGGVFFAKRTYDP